MHLGDRAAFGLQDVGHLHTDGVGAHRATRLLHRRGIRLRELDHGRDLQRHVARVFVERCHFALRVRAVQLHDGACPGVPMRRLSDRTATRLAGLVLSWGADPFVALSIDRPECRRGL